jgi:hypothetical protein
MTSKRTIAAKNLTTIQLSKATVQRLRQAESYPRETYDCIILRLSEEHTALAAKLKMLEAYPNEPVESTVDRLVIEHNSRISKGEQGNPIEKAKESTDGSDAAEVFQKELAKITGQK